MARILVAGIVSAVAAGSAAAATPSPGGDAGTITAADYERAQRNLYDTARSEATQFDQARPGRA